MKTRFPEQLFLIVILSFIGFDGFSQLYKGQFLIGGSGAYSAVHATSSNVTEKSTTISFSPNVGYFFTDRLAGGLKIDYSILNVKYLSSLSERLRTFFIGPTLRGYILPAERTINFFGEGSYGVTLGKYRNFGFPPDYKAHYRTYYLKAGPAFFLNEHTALELTLNYNHSRKGLFDTAITNTVMLGIGLQIHLGSHD